MAINFSALSNADTAPASTTYVRDMATEVRTETGELTLDLNKGISLDLDKAEPGLKNIIFATCWDAAESGPAIDVDISVFCLGANGKVSSVSDVVFFKNMQIPGIKLNGDNQTGDGDGDDETIDIELDKVSANYKELCFVANIYKAVERKQTFGMINNSYVKLLNKDDNNREICRFSLKDDYSSATGVIVAKLVNTDGKWSFVAVGDGRVVKDLNDILAIYS